MFTPTLTPRPGIMIVHPRLHSSSPTASAQFLRWTRLHFRDLLSIPALPSGGRITRTLRFSAPEAAGKYSHANPALESPLLYTCVASDVEIWHAPTYDAVPKDFGLERMRELGEGVMVWDVNDAAFTIYIEVAAEEEKNVPGYSEFAGTTDGARTWLVGIAAPGAHVSALQTAFLKRLEEMTEGRGNVYLSVYRNAGTEAQPKHHPFIGKNLVGSAEGIVLVLVVDEEGTGLDREGLEGVVEEWEREQGGDVKTGVWGGEVDMC